MTLVKIKAVLDRTQAALEALAVEVADAQHTDEAVIELHELAARARAMVEEARALEARLRDEIDGAEVLAGQVDGIASELDSIADSLEEFQEDEELDDE